MQEVQLQGFLFLANGQPAQNQAFHIKRHIAVEDKDQLFVINLLGESQASRQPQPLVVLILFFLPLLELASQLLLQQPSMFFQFQPGQLQS